MKRMLEQAVTSRKHRKICWHVPISFLHLQADSQASSFLRISAQVFTVIFGTDFCTQVLASSLSFLLKTRGLESMQIFQKAQNCFKRDITQKGYILNKMKFLYYFVAFSKVPLYYQKTELYIYSVVFSFHFQ